MTASRLLVAPSLFASTAMDDSGASPPSHTDQQEQPARPGSGNREAEDASGAGAVRPTSTTRLEVDALRAVLPEPPGDLEKPS